MRRSPSAVSQVAINPLEAMAILYVPFCGNCTSKLLRNFPVLVFVACVALPSGAVIIKSSNRIGA